MRFLIKSQNCVLLCGRFTGFTEKLCHCFHQIVSLTDNSENTYYIKIRFVFSQVLIIQVCQVLKLLPVHETRYRQAVGTETVFSKGSKGKSKLELEVNNSRNAPIARATRISLVSFSLLLLCDAAFKKCTYLMERFFLSIFINI